MTKPTTPEIRFGKALKAYFSKDISLTAPKTPYFIIYSKGDGFGINYPGLSHTRIDGDIDLSPCKELADFIKLNNRVEFNSTNIDGLRQTTISRLIKIEYASGTGISFIYLKKVKVDAPDQEDNLDNTEDINVESDPALAASKPTTATKDMTIKGIFPIVTDPTDAVSFRPNASDLIEKTLDIPASVFDDTSSLFRVYIDETTKELTLDIQPRYVFSSSFNNILIAPLKNPDAKYTLHYCHSDSESADWVMIESKGLYLTLRQWFRVIVR